MRPPPELMGEELIKWFAHRDWLLAVMREKGAKWKDIAIEFDISIRHAQKRYDRITAQLDLASVARGRFKHPTH